MGPLAGVRVIELASLAPAPFACAMLADMGADVLRIDRPSRELEAPLTLGRGKRSAILDLKKPAGRGALLRMVAHADILVEGNRPGVAERLGIGPEDCWEHNPRLVYGRMTGWGQTGLLAPEVGHDINYIAIAGALHPVGRVGERPVPPVNFVGDFGGGGMLLVVGLVSALVERARSGRGQVVDAAMVDGAALLTSCLHGMIAEGWWVDERGVNLTDGGAPFYDTYETSDREYVAVGAIEPRFYAALLDGLGLDPATVGPQDDQSSWPAMRERFREVFKIRTRAEWTAHFAGTEACVSPVLRLTEAPQNEHNRTRGTFVEVAGVPQPAPAPRFSRTPGAVSAGAPRPGQHTVDALRDWGLTADEIDDLTQQGVAVASAP
ncbi:MULTISPECIES: CaiB/BaiF CoA-transferase family protein [unclassified Pseudofrankia]|uniref:CaiB/BaiF CoA transferase family protein n=1 Tax=unclassified Pseudofrankia TaxID=2994372 RepID=UPI0008DA3E49|nr:MULTISPECIES: CaiB/BaiF CoA-transferase family protein [unclassified Pseudofrankia]MDT3445626.1 CaiB/BaiF CoA-transferase family protein [Pseudofrankia sp. BMG5.37]OHV63526.1 carnitine dehydratase [Pseudofrankia sp. BMG5.36]